MKPTLLCYNLSGAKASKIRFAAMRLRVLLRDVRPDEYGLTLNDLCGLETGGENVPCEETFPDEMLVMAGFTPMLMNQLLQTFRQMKIPPVPLKAMLTETNGQWDSCRLYRVISAEHEAMSRGGASRHQGPQA